MTVIATRPPRPAWQNPGPAPAWGPDAACRGLDPELFHPARGESTGEAKTVCRSCPVRVECLDWALATNQKHGLWGGLSERERRRIRRVRGLVDLDVLEDDHSGADPVIIDQEEPAVELTVATPPAPTSRPNGDRPTSICEECGDTYRRARSDQRFCSPRCRKKVTNRKRYAAMKAAPTARRPPPASTPVVPVPTTTGPPDLQVLLGQLLAGCDTWTVEADLGDVHLSISRGRG